jgi:dihydrodipicolinate synthase/N-acetylneuraminate lyase
MGKLEGIFTPLLMPLDGRGDINEPELRRFISWLIDHGVHGLYPNGSTGEFTRFTPEERRRITRIVCDEAGGRVPVLAGAAEANVKETLAACETYAGCGARAVAIVPPFYFRLQPQSVLAYFREIAANSPVDVTLYNIPKFASPIDLTTLERLMECPRIIGMKDSTGDVSLMMRMVAMSRRLRPDFSLLCGWEAVLAPMLIIGCDGGTNASSNVIPEVTRKIYELAKSGQVEEAVRLNYRILSIFDAMIDPPFEFPDGFRAAAALRGFNFGRPRQPLTAAQERDRAAMAGKVQALLAEFGYVESPRCARPQSDDQVSRIVYEVLQELEGRGLI